MAQPCHDSVVVIRWIKSWKTNRILKRYKNIKENMTEIQVRVLFYCPLHFNDLLRTGRLTGRHYLYRYAYLDLSLRLTHRLALLNFFNRGRQPALWKWCPPHQAGLDLFAHLAYPVDFTYHSLPMIPFPQLNPIYTSLETLLLIPTGALPIQGCLANESKT